MPVASEFLPPPKIIQHGITEWKSATCTVIAKVCLTQYIYYAIYVNVTKLNSMALVHKQTIPTGRPPLVAEVVANFCG
jgi:hypothetical protein